MKKINLNIKIPQKYIFNEELFKQEHPDLYVEYTIPPTKESALQIVLNWIGNMIESGANAVDPKTGRATKRSDMELQRKYNQVMNALENNKDGIAALDDDDYRFLNRKYHQGGAPLIRDINKILVPISDAIKRAEIEETKDSSK